MNNLIQGDSSGALTKLVYAHNSNEFGVFSSMYTEFLYLDKGSSTTRIFRTGDAITDFILEIKVPEIYLVDNNIYKMIDKIVLSTNIGILSSISGELLKILLELYPPNYEIKAYKDTFLIPLWFFGNNSSINTIDLIVTSWTDLSVTLELNNTAICVSEYYQKNIEKLNKDSTSLLSRLPKFIIDHYILPQIIDNFNFSAKISGKYLFYETNKRGVIGRTKTQKTVNPFLDYYCYSIIDGKIWDNNVIDPSILVGHQIFDMLIVKIESDNFNFDDLDTISIKCNGHEIINLNPTFCMINARSHQIHLDPSQSIYIYKFDQNEIVDLRNHNITLSVKTNKSIITGKLKIWLRNVKELLHGDGFLKYA